MRRLTFTPQGRVERGLHRLGIFLGTILILAGAAAFLYEVQAPMGPRKDFERLTVAERQKVRRAYEVAEYGVGKTPLPESNPFWSLVPSAVAEYPRTIDLERVFWLGFSGVLVYAFFRGLGWVIAGFAR